MPAATTVDTSLINDGIRCAISIADRYGRHVPIMPKDVLGILFVSDRPDWTEDIGLHSLREVLFDQLGNELVKSGEAEARMFRYSVREPHEFQSPKRPYVSLYLNLMIPGQYKPYVQFELGPPDHPRVF